MKYFKFETYVPGSGAECLSGIETYWSSGIDLIEAKERLVDEVGCANNFFDDNQTTITEVDESTYKDNESGDSDNCKKQEENGDLTVNQKLILKISEDTKYRFTIWTTAQFDDGTIQEDSRIICCDSVDELCESLRVYVGNLLND